ncbi:membrane protein SEC59 [Histoplasma capsulatum G186AR]|uniref:dolichol kinase n=1 Tax=Ajellomyces capsulatus TaxID=5037 RepID=A0A8H7Z5H2_AJECA|nr:membrane protein SEC59 [Histoplasma capsulatum]QSS70092.1 membrane protein SEC59 [Histoplasma capsulatum G186AR]
MATQDARRGNGESLDSHEPLLIAPSFLDSRRQLSRSPRPYSRRGSSLITPMDNVESGNYTTSRGKSSITSSESGTEADDESTGFLKGLPAPQIRPRQTLSLGKWNAQGKREGLTGEKLWSAFRRSRLVSSRRDSSEDACRDEIDVREEVARRNRSEVLRRLFETGLVLVVGVVVYFGKDVRYSARAWNGELSTFSITILVLYLIYPFQITTYGFRRRRWKAIVAFPFSTNLDPAPLIYPVLLPVLIALSLIHNHQVSILPNIILGLSSIPSPVIPFYTIRHGFVITHWAITILPVITSNIRSRSSEPFQGLNPELLLLIFPLHQALVTTLHFFSTTSLLHTELQLLATGLLNVLFFANSSQGEILKALLWLGGICMLFLCQHVLRWEVILARIPSWKFRRSPRRDDRRGGYLKMLDHNICYSLSHVGHDGEALSDSDVPVSGFAMIRGGKDNQGHNIFMKHNVSKISDDRAATPRVDPALLDNMQSNYEILPQEFPANAQSKSAHSHRRQPSVFANGDVDGNVKTTPGGRRRRLMTPNLQSFLSLTAAQAQVRKWAYALYTYAATLFIILVPVRKYVGQNALHGNEPFGWAIGYLFGNIPSVRFQIVKNNLENWVRIPPLLDTEMDNKSCHLGWVDHLRRDTLGEANTRLLIACYCALVIMVGLGLVIRLSGAVEVDTRRKVFHGMMVLMFLPTTFIDPTFTALALALILAIFLLLDLFRASQLPPISKPLTYFLAPYVDGRDHRGPIIVSHIFLLIGCAIPLWLSLAGIPRTGSPPWKGWDVETRDLSMVSGVICVGMGDAAASLVGRRYGRHKWFWGGGKSVEGSMAFAVVVFVGILTARLWFIVGGWDRSVSVPISRAISPSWPTMATSKGWAVVVSKSILAALVSSSMEAVLSGGNDNVVVPLVLWLLVRGLGL